MMALSGELIGGNLAFLKVFGNFEKSERVE